MLDLAWQSKCRDEDIKQRAFENERRKIDDARRMVDEKSNQLKSVAHQAALLAGFCMIILVEIEIPDNIPAPLLIAFTCSGAIVVCLMLIAMLNTTFILVAILRYDTVERQVDFPRFWANRCESDWRLSIRAFTFGVPIFILLLGQVGWVTHWKKTESHAWIYSSSCLSVIAVLTITIYYVHIWRKWNEWIVFDSQHNT